MRSKGVIGFAVLITIFVIGLLLIIATSIKRKTSDNSGLPNQTLSPTLKPSPKLSIQNNLSPTPTPFIIEGKNGWKTYVDEKNGYQIDFPSSWYIQGFPTIPSDSIAISSSNIINPQREQILLDCPSGGWERKKLPVPKDWEGGDAGILTKYYSKIELNGMEGIQYIFGTPKDTPGKPMNYLCTALLEKTIPYVCDVCTTQIEDREKYNREFILTLENYNKILSTFRFLPSGPSDIEPTN